MQLKGQLSQQVPLWEEDGATISMSHKAKDLHATVTHGEFYELV